MTADPSRVQKTLEVAEQELRRVLEFGFTPEEIQRARLDLVKRLGNARLQEESLRSDRLADGWVDCITADRVPTSASWDADFAGSFLENATTDRVWKSFCRLWAPKNRAIYVSGNLPGTLTESMLHGVYNKSRRTILRMPTREAPRSFAYDKFGEQGDVIRQWKEEGLGLQCFQFANGVRLNVRPTDFEKGQVHVRLRVGDGLLSEPQDCPGLSRFAHWSFVEGGLGKYSWEELRDLLAGHVVTAQFATGSDAFFLSGRTTAEDFPLQMRLLTAYVADAGFRSEGEREAQKIAAQVYPELSHTVEGVMMDGGDRFLHGDDPRFGFPSQAQLESYSMQHLHEWLLPQLREGYLEVTVVGDVDGEEVLRVVAQTLGALPEKRKDATPSTASLALPMGKSVNLTYATEIPKGFVQLCWATDDGWNRDQKRCLDLLADILADRVRVRIRKEMGDAYSPVAGHVASFTFKNYGYLYVNALVDRERVNDIAFIAREIAGELLANGLDEDEFTRIWQPALTEVREQLRRNGHWLNGVDGTQARPEKLEFLRTLLPFYENVRRADVEAVRKFLSEKRQITIKVQPNLP
jgi:zinc protease